MITQYLYPSADNVPYFIQRKRTHVLGVREVDWKATFKPNLKKYAKFLLLVLEKTFLREATVRAKI